MLDISTPPLSRLTIKGTLYYDWTQPLLNLQTRTLYVDGGNLTIASANGMPYLSTSRAHITLLGLPPDDGRNNIADMEQTVFDKAFAVRQGTVTLNGATQYPAFTTLNATADAGATSIMVNGLVTYMVGWGWGGRGRRNSPRAVALHITGVVCVTRLPHAMQCCRVCV